MRETNKIKQIDLILKLFKNFLIKFFKFYYMNA